jgi:hypothetical protein
MAAARPLLEDDSAEDEPPEEKDEPREVVERPEVVIAERCRRQRPAAIFSSRAE